MGLVGVGETLARFSPKAYVELIETSLKPRLVGQDARNIGALWHSMRRSLSGRAGGMLVEAIAGVDIALWDIIGKAAGQPVAKLLGGMGRDIIDVYAAAVNWVGDDEADGELERYIGEGFPRIRSQDGRTPSEKPAVRIERLRKQRRRRYRTLRRRRTGPTIWTRRSRSARALYGQRLLLVRGAAARPKTSRATKNSASAASVPLAAGESNFTAHQAQRLITNRTLSVAAARCRPRRRHIRDTAHGRLCRTCTMLSYAPHIGMSGIICETASAHLAAGPSEFPR